MFPTSRGCSSPSAAVASRREWASRCAARARRWSSSACRRRRARRSRALGDGQSTAGEPAPGATIADGIAIRQPGRLTMPLLRELLSDLVVVSEDEIAQAIVFLAERAKLVSEGAGAVATAALLSGRCSGRQGTTVAVVSGGNVDSGLLAGPAAQERDRGGPAREDLHARVRSPGRPRRAARPRRPRARERRERRAPARGGAAARPRDGRRARRSRRVAPSTRRRCSRRSSPTATRRRSSSPRPRLPDRADAIREARRARLRSSARAGSRAARAPCRS